MRQGFKICCGSLLKIIARWAGVGEARGDYPISNHKLTIQFYDAHVARDRKLEGLIHNAVLELWRPDPNELTRLMAKGINLSLIEVPPNAFTLTGSTDPCYVEGYHLSNANDGRITLHLKLRYAAKTWYGGFVGMMISGASEVSRNVG